MSDVDVSVPDQTVGLPGVLDPIPSRGNVIALQVLVVVAFLCAWQWAPDLAVVRHMLGGTGRTFISSPTETAPRVWQLLTGSHGTPSIWSYLATTLQSTAIGAASGLLVGGLLGLVLSSSKLLQAVSEPFGVALNSVPRIALIPIVVVLFRSPVVAAGATAFILVVFVCFFNAFEGGKSVPVPILENAALLGATRWQLMRHIRASYVLVWTFATVPNAISFALIAVIGTELITGTGGVGGLMIQSITNLDASLDFALVVIVSVVGIVIYLLVNQLRRYVLRWQ